MFQNIHILSSKQIMLVTQKNLKYKIFNNIVAFCCMNFHHYKHNKKKIYVSKKNFLNNYIGKEITSQSIK